MSEAIKSINASAAAHIELRRPAILNYLPALLPIVGAVLMLLARIKVGTGFINDGSLVVIALLCYIFAAALHLTDLYAPNKTLQKAALWTASLGFFFNLSGWLVRWVNMGDHEGWKRLIDADGVYHSWWFFSYVPFANLYDLSLAFAFGAAFTTLLIEHRPNARFVGAIALPLITLILMLAVFIGSEIGNLQPILDSYWRPIHVGVASLSYGIALVSFAIAVMFLLKDGVKPEAMGIFTSGFVLASLLGFSKAFSLTTLSYKLTPALAGKDGATIFIKPIRAALPGVGPLVAISVLLLLAVAVCFLLYLFKNNEQARRYGHWALRASLVTQGASIVWLFYQIKNVHGISPNVSPEQMHELGKWMAGPEGARMSVVQAVQDANSFLQQSASAMSFNINSNPVELAALITGFVLTLFIFLFSLRPERLRAGLPSLEKLDSLVYKTVGAAFAGIAILLVTGAIWANESWGRPWGWDSKETGALVAWIAYAGYLHTRIAHGWSGRKSAYFALVGFLLVIFTYLGVSYLLPGLHSYAE